MIVETACLLAGPVISGGVSVLKRIPLVKKYPKTISFIFSAITGASASIVGNVGTEWVQLVECTLVPFAGSIATYEAVTRQVKKKLITE